MTEREAANGLIELQTETTARVNLWKNKCVSHGAVTKDCEEWDAIHETKAKIIRLLTRMKLENARIDPLKYPEAASLVSRTADDFESRVEAVSFKDLRYTAIRQGDTIVRLVPREWTTAYVL